MRFQVNQISTSVAGDFYQAEKLAVGGAVETGAHACVGVIGLDEYLAELRAYPICTVTEHASAPEGQSPEVVRESLAHLRRNLGLIFNQPRSIKRKEKP